MSPALRLVRSCCVPLALAALPLVLPPGSALATMVPGVGEYFAYSLQASTMDAATLTCFSVSGDRPVPSDPFADSALQIAAPGPTTPLALSLQYESTGGPEVILETLEIDNATLELLKGGVPVSSFLDVFGPLPPPVSPQAVLECQAPRTVVLILDALLGAINAQPAVYQTDGGTTIPVETDGNPNEADITQQNADQVLMNAGFEYGDPNADKLEQVAPPSDSYDCHGFTFTKGDRWINDYECDGQNDAKGFQTVQKILNENGYTAIADSQAVAGDIVVYRANHDACADAPAADKITHTGKIVLVKTDGTLIVESKWGRFGRYKHKKGRVPSFYGTATVYRTTRPGQGGNRHTLAQGVPAQPVSVQEDTWGRIKARFR